MRGCSVRGWAVAPGRFTGLRWAVHSWGLELAAAPKPPDNVGSAVCAAQNFWVYTPLPPFFFLSFLCLYFIGMTKPFNYVSSKHS